jgi:hypothetical protein
MNDPGAKILSTTWNGSAKKEKRSKKERKGRPVETAAAVEIEQGGFGDFLLISTAAWKSLRKNRYGFSTVTTGPTTANYSTWRPLSFDVSHGWGAVH